MSESATQNSADILIVEDEAAIARLMSLHLRAAGFSTRCCEDGDSAMVALSNGQWRLVVLDRMLPGTSGMKILRWLKSEASGEHIPVLMVTALSLTSERVHGLNEGADDYLAKPFEPDELVARVKALLRRNRMVEKGSRTECSIRLDPEVDVVFEGDERVELRPMEYRLLELLMAKPGKTRSRNYLLDHVWGMDAEVEDRTVDVTIKRLRKALKKIGRKHCVETIRGRGYRFVPPSD